MAQKLEWFAWVFKRHYWISLWRVFCWNILARVSGSSWKIICCKPYRILLFTFRNICFDQFHLLFKLLR